MTKTIIHDAVQDLAESAKSVYGSKLKDIILFGSCARGDFGEDSDVDIMILLDVPMDKVNEEMGRLNPIIHSLDRKYDYEMLFAPIVQSYDIFHYWLDVTPFYQNILNEGVHYA